MKKLFSPLGCSAALLTLVSAGAFAQDQKAAGDTALATTKSAVVHCKGPEVIVLGVPPPWRPASGDFQIAATFSANVTGPQQAVIRQAIHEWDGLLTSRGVNPGRYSINISFDSIADPTVLAFTTTSSYSDGTLASASMVFDTGHPWFVDPTPADDGEFGANPPAGFDLLTVARHELGHALGWTKTALVTNLVANGIFDVVRLNIGVVGNGAHANPAAHPNELMVPSIGGSMRRPIQLYPTAALVARAYQQAIPMHFVDPAYPGTQTGTAWQPWRTFQTAMTQTPSQMPLLLAPNTFVVPDGQPLNTAHSIYSARGGATLTVQR